MHPFARGSISLRLYPHLDLAAPEIVEELCAQAGLAIECGFDGVMTSEHHGGFAGYLPNPLQAAGFVLGAMPSGWAAPCPLLLPLRAPALVAEEAAWLAARYPDRVGLGLAAGALPADFEIMGLDLEGLTQRFAAALGEVARLLTHGDPGGPLAADPAIARCAQHPVPLLSAASSVTAAQRAAGCGVGLLLDSLTTPERCHELIDAFHAAGGTAPCVLIRRAWVGEPFVAEIAQQLDVYREYAPPNAQAHWGDDEQHSASNPGEVVDLLLDALRRSGADALNVRVHVAGVPPAAAREQIKRIGTDVLPAVRAALH